MALYWRRKRHATGAERQTGVIARSGSAAFTPPVNGHSWPFFNHKIKDIDGFAAAIGE